MSDYVLRNVPMLFWRRVKTQAAREACTIRSVILSLLDEWLKRKERP